MLSDFLETMAAAPFVDGETDCALSLADWVMTATGCPDPAAHLRGRYRTALGRERILRRGGGLVAVVADCAARAALTETVTPKARDVGVVVHEGEMIAAICLGARWAAKGQGVVVFTPTDVLKAWSV